MAKTKTPKVKDLRPEKITDEQLAKVQVNINNINRAQLEIGSIESKKHNILHSIAGLQEELSSLQKEFQEQYGTFDVSIQDGTINYPKDNGKADKKD